MINRDKFFVKILSIGASEKKPYFNPDITIKIGACSTDQLGYFQKFQQVT